MVGHLIPGALRFFPIPSNLLFMMLSPESDNTLVVYIGANLTVDLTSNQINIINTGLRNFPAFSIFEAFLFRVPIGLEHIFPALTRALTRFQSSLLLISLSSVHTK